MYHIRELYGSSPTVTVLELFLRVARGKTASSETLHGPSGEPPERLSIVRKSTEPQPPGEAGGSVPPDARRPSPAWRYRRSANERAGTPKFAALRKAAE